MFLKYFDFIFAPFRAINSKIVGVKNIKGNIKVDVQRVQMLGKVGQARVAEAKDKMNAAGGQAQQGAQAMQQATGQAPGAAPAAPAAPSAPAIRTEGFWFFKKKFCTQCSSQLDNSWDSCPFCAQIAQQVVVAATAPKGPLKTQAFVIDASGQPGQMQLLGWLVPLQGPQRGELFTLSPNSSIGTEPTCTVCLNDKFMSSKHAEIKAEGGLWVLKDLGSTNGTYVNNKRVDKHELVDNDFIKFGSALVKFKSL
jgi:hypothetical protein